MEHLALVRAGSFVLVLGLMLALELRFPRRVLEGSKPRRLAANLGIIGLSTGLVWLVFPILPAGAALWARQAGVGLMNVVAMPLWVQWVLAILVLDLAIWAQHLAFHRVPLLWLVHRMHHADVGLDTTTGVRFHPIEIVASLVWKMGLVVVLGAPPLAVLAFEVVLNATSLFNHANLALPLGLDRWLRLVVVTPDMHRVHHSTSPREFNTNLGFNLPWWDRAFGTYKAQPDQGHETMKLGLNIFREPRWLALHRMLAMPFC